MIPSIKQIAKRIVKLEEENAQLRNSVDRLTRYLGIIAGNMAGADTTMDTGLHNSEIPVVTDVCLDAPIFWGRVAGEGEAEAASQIGPVVLEWNGDAWTAGSSKILEADVNNRDDQSVIDPEEVTNATMVRDIDGNYRYLANAFFPRPDGGMCLTDAVFLSSPTEDYGQLAVVYEDFGTEAPLGDGRTKLALPICVLV